MASFIRPARVSECVAMAYRLREADKAEIAATSGKSPARSLTAGWRLSNEVRAWVLNDKVEAISGTREIEPGLAFPWLVGSDAIFGSAKWAFARLSRGEVERLNSMWPHLVGRVHAANAAHVRWLEWCGFSLSEPVPHGVSGDPFYPFERFANV